MCHVIAYYKIVIFPVIVGKSIPQVALKWLLQQEVVSSVIIGAKTLAQLEDNMGAGTSWKLTDEQVTATLKYSQVLPEMMSVSYDILTIT